MAARLQGSMTSLWRSLSGATKKEAGHLRPTTSMDIPGEGRSCGEEDSAAELEQQQRPRGLRPSLSLPTNYAAMERSCSLADSASSSSPGTPSGGFLAQEDSPKAAAAAHSLGGSGAQEQQQQAAQHSRKPFKVHGMDPYDYWSMIKSL